MIRRRRAVLVPAAALVLALLPSSIRAQAAPPATTTVAPGLFVLSGSGGNTVVLTGSEGALVLGPQAPETVARTRAFLAAHSDPRVRYVVLAPGNQALRNGDAGWGQRGAATIAQEAIFYALRGNGRGSAGKPAGPRQGFSEVMQLMFGGDEIHMVHQLAGFSDADFSAHFERSHLLYLGALFTTDGYPEIDLEHGGTLAGMIRAADGFLEMFGGSPNAVHPIVPGRGPLATIADLRAYRDMLAAVRDRVQPMVKDGKTLAEVVAAHPTARFDARWGHGPVKPDAFVGMVYRSLSK